MKNEDNQRLENPQDIAALKKLLVNRFENHSFAKSVGIKVEQIQYKKAVASLQITEKHLNANGTVHGGALMTLADNAAGASVIFTGQVAPTVELQYRFLKPVYAGDTVKAYAEVVHAGGSILVILVEMKVGESLVGVADASFYRLRHKVTEIPKEIFDKADDFIKENIK